jgi:hypothetical protein
MKIKFPFLITLFLGLFVSIIAGGCSKQSTSSLATSAPEQVQENTPVAVQEATSFPQPEAEKTSVTGRVLSSETGEPITNILVRLARVVRDGDRAAFVLEDAHSPGGMTDENGYFIVPNVDPLEYVLVVGDVYGVYQIVEDEDGRAKPWPTTVGEVVDVGDLEVDLTLP